MQYHNPDFLQRLASDQLSKQEHAKFKKWLDGLSDQQTRHYLDLYEQHAITAKSAHVLRSAVAPRIEQAIDQWERSHPAKKFINWAKVWSVAAIVALLIASSVCVYMYLQQEEMMLVVAADKGKAKKVALMDGSVVMLNKGSKLHYPVKFSTESRTVRLEGEAFFEVVHHASLPFVVETGNLQTKVLGTKFNVKTTAATTKVALLQGKVQVSDGQQHMMLAPSEQVVYATTDRTYHKQQIPSYLITAWFDKQIDFHNQPLHKVTEALAAMYEVDFVFEHEAVKQCPVTISIEKTSISTAMRALKFAMGIDYTINKKQITIKGKCRS